MHEALKAEPLLPPACIGVIGGGQLGMMLVREARRMGYETIVWDPDPRCPAARVSGTAIAAPFDDATAADRMAEGADVITYEFENVDPQMVERLEGRKPLLPGSAILRTARHRLREKEELRARGFPTVRFAAARTRSEVREALRTVGLPSVVKTATAGYDGKGQKVLEDEPSAERFLTSQIPPGAEYVVEEFVRLRTEISVLVLRSRNGEVRCFPPAENAHRENILYRSVIPARIGSELTLRALAMGSDIIRSFSLTGLLCVEMFLTHAGDLLVNELAPRPHNSGHWSLDASTISQFEGLVRVLCNLPVPEPGMLCPCGMLNILGRHMGKLDFPGLLSAEGVKLHLYGKHRVEPARKMGHITVTGPSPEVVEERLARIEAMLESS